MAHFYGTLQGIRGMATRCGAKSSGMTTVAASWGGAVRVSLTHDQEGHDVATVELVPWHGHGVRRVLFEGRVNGSETAPALCPKCGAGVSDCASFGCGIDPADECCETHADCGGPLEKCSDGEIRCDAHADAFESARR